MTVPSSDALQSSSEEIRARVDEAFDAAVEQLIELIRIPSVSWPAFDSTYVDTSAQRIASLANELGIFDSVEVLRAKTDPQGSELGQPAVLAHRAADPGMPHVLLYAHHDVQPPGDESLWESEPYEPVVRGQRLYGRGSSDDKAGVVSHLTALRVLRDLECDGGRIGISLFVEGEEEAGSRSFDQFLVDHHDKLWADVIVVADSDNVDVETPAITTALRGNVTFRLTVRTLEHANHSGMFGGAVPDAPMAFIRLMNSCWDENGSVDIGGLRSAELPGIAYSEDQLRLETGLIGSPIGAGDIVQRIWAQPTVTVTGMNIPNLAAASNTLVPEVSARVSVRVAPGQPANDAWEAVRTHLERHTPWGARISFAEVDCGEPFLVDTAGTQFAAMKNALRDGWAAEGGGVHVAEIGVGGSIPFIASLAKQFPDAEILVTAVGDPLSYPHSPNESQHLGVLRKAMLSEALYLARLAGLEYQAPVAG